MMLEIVKMYILDSQNYLVFNFCSLGFLNFDQFWEIQKFKFIVSMYQPTLNHQNLKLQLISVFKTMQKWSHIILQLQSLLTIEPKYSKLTIAIFRWFSV